MRGSKNTAAVASPIASAIAFALAVCGLAGCGGEAASTPPRPPDPEAPAPPAASVLPVASAAASGDADAGAPPADAGAKGACPEGMALVDTTYCPKPKLHCLRPEYERANHLTICHEFAPGQTCLAEERRQRFCIDRYEYPNREGAHPPVMVSWYDARAACAAEGKRLCWQSEWESACEGPQKLPFPYGLRRDKAQCNIDNAYVKPDLDRVYSAKPEVHGPELLKLDQGVASGAKPGCVSGFGVHDLTGNFDEWVNSEENKGKSKWAGLKGGAWGHVRNACRPMTTSHPPEFTYYFISFRCCADAASDGGGGAPIWRPPPQPAQPAPGGRTSPGWTTKERGPNRPG